jgi:hypothetical protein
VANKIEGEVLDGLSQVAMHMESIHLCDSLEHVAVLSISLHAGGTDILFAGILIARTARPRVIVDFAGSSQPGW